MCPGSIMGDHQHKVFIGGLSWETTGEKLRSYFENYGVVREAFVSYNRNNGRPRGFGFVVFESSEVADKVVAAKHTIDRREVEAKKAVPKDEQLYLEHQPRQQPLSVANSEVSAGRGCSRKIFVGGLAPSVDDRVLREHFEQFGAVDDTVVMYDHDNKRPRGFGFVTFATEDSVPLVFAKGSMQSIQDKQIEIKSAVPRDQMHATQRTPLMAFDQRIAGARSNSLPYTNQVSSQFGNVPRGYSHGYAPGMQAGARAMPMPIHRPESQPSGKVPPMAGSYDSLFSAGTLGTGNSGMFGTSTQAALAYSIASLHQQAQLYGMQSVSGDTADKLDAADFGAANSLSLKALALAGGFGGAFPSSQRADTAPFPDHANGYQQGHSDYSAATAAAAAAAMRLNAVGLSPDFTYHDASFATAPAPGWSS